MRRALLLASLFALSAGGAWAQDADLKACAPTSLNAAVDCLNKHLPDEAKTRLLDRPFDNLVEEHFGLGMWIRNNWALWGDGPLAEDMRMQGFRHPDDISTVILNSFWLDHHGCPRQIGAQARYYHAWWTAAEASKTQGRPDAFPPKIDKPHLDCTAGKEKA